MQQPATFLEVIPEYRRFLCSPPPPPADPVEFEAREDAPFSYCISRDPTMSHLVSACKERDIEFMSEKNVLLPKFYVESCD